jgi:hypothetical protein
MKTEEERLDDPWRLIVDNPRVSEDEVQHELNDLFHAFDDFFGYASWREKITEARNWAKYYFNARTDADAAHARTLLLQTLYVGRMVAQRLRRADEARRLREDEGGKI